MKRIIAAFDGLKYCESTAAYAIDLGKKYDATVLGVFLEDITYHSFSLADMAAEENSIERRTRQLATHDQNTRDRAIKVFKEACQEAGVKHAVHRDRNIALQELVHESLFADLLIVQKKETLTHFTEEVPTRFIKDLLEKAACPILLVSEYYHRSEKNIFLYDGSRPSMYALKQFACLFAGKAQSLEVLTVRGEKQQLLLPDAHLLKEWLKDHYTDVEYNIVRGEAEQEIVNELKRKAKYPIVILGAYDRGRLSRWLRPSVADRIMSELDYPIFISHQ
jgi:nucleotide-binding universal stress UspA family protein